MRALLYITIFLLLALAVRGEPPFQTIQEGSGLTIIYPQLDTHKANTNLTLRYQVYNTSNYRVTNETASCEIFLCAGECENPTKKTLLYDTTGQNFYTYYDQTNETGRYSWLVACNDTYGRAGFVSTYFSVTLDGRTDTEEWQTPAAILVLGLLGFIVVMSIIVDKNNVFMRIAKMFFVMVSWFLTIAVMNLARGFALSNDAPKYIVDTLDILYVADIWVTIFFTAIIIIYFINEVLYAMGWVKGRGFKPI